MVARRARWLALVVALAGMPGGVLAATDMSEGQVVSPPAGFVDFCRRHADECGARTTQPESTHLTSARLTELVRVQEAVNRDVAYRPDSFTFGKRDFWEFPFVYGDCEDIALKKRRELVRLGWPRENLLLTLVGLPTGGLHMVLVAVTDHGDLVLDNLHRQLAVPDRLNYRWLSRQSRRDESTWVAIVADAAASPHL